MSRTSRLLIGIALLAVFLFVNLLTDYGAVGYLNNSELTMMQGTGGVAFFAIVLGAVGLELFWISRLLTGDDRFGTRTVVCIVLAIMIGFGLYTFITYDGTRQQGGSWIPIPPIVRMY